MNTIITGLVLSIVITSGIGITWLALYRGDGRQP